MPKLHKITLLSLLAITLTACDNRTGGIRSFENNPENNKNDNIPWETKAQNIIENTTNFIEQKDKTVIPLINNISNDLSNKFNTFTDDIAIKSVIVDSVSKLPVANKNISITVNDGNVILEGFQYNTKDIVMIVNHVAKINGVKSVKNLLIVYNEAIHPNIKSDTNTLNNISQSLNSIYDTTNEQKDKAKTFFSINNYLKQNSVLNIKIDLQDQMTIVIYGSFYDTKEKVNFINYLKTLPNVKKIIDRSTIDHQ